MHASLIIVFGLIALTKAWPASLPDSNAKANVTPGPNSSITPTDILSDIQAAFEQTCHNTCLKLFPDKGTGQDNCMNICHHHSDSDSGQDSGEGSGM